VAKTQYPRIQVVNSPPEGCGDEYPWKGGELVLLLGEIQNMKGHVVLATKDGKIHWGWHLENFREPEDHEL
jgi:hypothetical protein